MKLVMQSCVKLTEYFWNPLRIVELPLDLKYALIILNRSIRLSPATLYPLWEKARVKITVDGGTNHWMKFIGDEVNSLFNGQSKQYLPTLVTGDMDSILPEYLEKLKNTDAKVVYTMDQNDTDFTKSIMELGKYLTQNNLSLNRVYVLVETDGRLDHIIGFINTLYKCDKYIPNIPVILISSNSLTWLLKSGKHVIKIPEILVSSQSWCSLIPFGSSENCVTTTGLKWNLENSRLQFGGMVSTSNSYNGESEVTVLSDTSLVWSMGIEKIIGNEEIY